MSGTSHSPEQQNLNLRRSYRQRGSKVSVPNHYAISHLHQFRSQMQLTTNHIILEKSVKKSFIQILKIKIPDPGIFKKS